ncbi:hypothetical protein F4825DRAFT_128901 [Nemania diffusa]|nr:hypothetical protein F4825DRAFT_128901 [Nemania diffusa]
MVSDKERKNCLHWAAQFGNLKTVEFIQARLRSDGILARYINQPDSDGWTSLCWAARPHHAGWARKMRSEQPDFAGVVKALLVNGAHRDVKCTLGNGTSTEELTPLGLARRCDAGGDIIDMLQHSVVNQAKFKTHSTVVTRGSVRIYALHPLICDVCFNVSSPPALKP